MKLRIIKSNVFFQKIISKLHYQYRVYLALNI